MLDGYKILTATHRNTPLQAIGDFGVSHLEEAGLRARLEVLKNKFKLDELLYLATCNRVMYFFYTEKKIAPAFREQFLLAVNPQLSVDDILAHATLLEGEEAAGHLFKVAASIDSLVVGEREILRQLREAYDRCKAWGLTGDHLRLAVKGCVAAAKEVYGETKLGEKSVSVVSLAVKELLKTKLPKDARILMIGAGQTNLLVAKFLAKYGFQNVAVFNRTLEKATLVANMLGGQAFELSDLENYRNGFDCLIVCTGATQAVVDKKLYASLLGNDPGRKVVIDLSVPNNVCREVTKDRFNVHYIEIENLRALAEENLAFREQEISVACDLLDRHLSGFKDAARQRRIERALHKIPVEVKAVRERAMNEVFKKEVESLDGPTRLLLDRMMAYMEKKCTGIPIKVAKEALT